MFKFTVIPPPFSSAVNGNLQTFPRPTDRAMQDSRNSISLPHLSLATNSCDVCEKFKNE